MLPLVVLPAHHYRIFNPDQALSYSHARLPAGRAEVVPLAVGMPDMERAARFQAVNRILKGSRQELAERRISHVVILDRHDLAVFSLALIGHIVGRIGEQHIRFLSVHQDSNRLFIGAVAAQQAMPANLPEVAHYSDRRFLCDFRRHIINHLGTEAVLQDIYKILYFIIRVSGKLQVSINL